MSDLAPLIEVLRTIEPYLSDIVLVGGWVPIVYEQCTSIYPTKTVRTADIDFACHPPLVVRGETMDSLLKKACFTCELSGGTSVPFSKYVNKLGLEIEFLTPLKGPGTERVTELQRGLTAEPLRYLDVLLEHVEEVNIDEGLCVRVPSMSAFLFQKGLSFPHRRSFLKRDKDLYYIFKVVETVNPEYLIASLDTVFKAHPPKWRSRFFNNLRQYFEEEHSVGVISVVGQLLQTPSERDDRDILRMKVFTTMQEFLDHF
ncbi:MAG: GSU2403 family nucleotidyltransferase fold protein [Syntrophorhabdales bacterium]